MHDQVDILASDACAPDTVVAIDAHRSLTHSQMRHKVAAIAKAIASLDGQRWLPLATNALDFSVAFLGILSAGRTVVMSPSSQVDTVADSALGIDAVLSESPLVDSPLPWLSLDGIDSHSGAPAPILPSATIELFTSGSTGDPKRVVKQFRQLVDEAGVLAKTFDSQLGDAVVLSTVPHHHIYGLLFRIIWPLRSTRRFHAMQTLTPTTKAEDAAVLVTSPAFLKRLVDPQSLRRNHLRVVFSSGGALDSATAKQIAEAADCPLIEVYGSTETGGIAWRHWPDGDGLWSFFAEVDHDLEPQPDTEVSRLSVRSPATGNEWMDTADLVEMHDSGFFLLGRADGVLKVEDKRVSLAAIEACLNEHELVNAARVLLLEGRRHEVAAVIQLESGEEIDSNKARRSLVKILKQQLARRFDQVAMPRRWRFVAEMPADAMGKTTRAALLELFAGGGA